MSYSKTNWVDGQTLLNAANLNKLEAGVEQAHVANQSTSESHIELSKKVRTWGPTFDSSNGHVIMVPAVEGFNT